MTAVEDPAGSAGTRHQLESRVPDGRIFATIRSGSHSGLPTLCNDLLRDQQSSWPQLIDGYSGFKATTTREVQCEGYSVRIQFNPGRITSTGAKTDPRSISNRKCFLCVDNLPPGQKGVLYRDEFLVLCNPAPILDKHLTVSHVSHIPQAIERFVPAFLDLAREMSPSFTVFYNGPRCGASAPDHLHFQASPAGAIPVEREAGDPARRVLRKRKDRTSFYTLQEMGRGILVIEGTEASKIEQAFWAVMLSLRRILPSDQEPMVNVLCSFHEREWRVILFPRTKHRPDFYFLDGDARILISPAAIDVGGLIVTPLEKDFMRMDAETVQAMFREVVMNEETVDRIIASA